MSVTTADVLISRQHFLDDRQGRTFADVVNDPGQPFEQVLAFFNDADRQRRMEESEIHHNRPPLAGVVREFEASPDVDLFLASQHPRRTKRLRQAVGVVVRMIMELRGWRKTGKKGSLGVRAKRRLQHLNGVFEQFIAYRMPKPVICHLHIIQIIAEREL